MNRRVVENYEAIAQSLGFRLDKESGVMYGTKGTYSMLLYAPQGGSAPYVFCLTASVRRGDGPLTREEQRQLQKENKFVTKVEQKGNRITLRFRKINNQDRLREAIRSSMDFLAEFLRQAGFQNCCQTCGQTGATGECIASGAPMLLCSSCYGAMQREAAVKGSKLQTESVLTGLVGALLGSLVGVASILLLSQLGYVSALSGVLMAVCTLKGYEWMGRRISKKGVVLCVLVMLVMTFVGDWLDWAVLLAQELEVRLAIAFRAMPGLLQEEIIPMSNYLGNLGILYLFVLLGMVPTVHNILRNQAQRGQVRWLGGPVE